MHGGDLEWCRASSLRNTRMFRTLTRYSFSHLGDRMVNVAILGSTGSIGRSSLEVIAAFPDRFRVTSLTAHRNIELLERQIERFHPALAAVASTGHVPARQIRSCGTTRILAGNDGLLEAATHPDVDLVINALVGFSGLIPTMRAIEAGKDIALANKESLVVGGDLIMRTARKHGVRILPIDSEHSAILQCLQGENMSQVARIILTASGGPFWNLAPHEFESITPKQALIHPTWRMGNKITIDSATMMNKGLEVIEAYWLFGLPPDRIDVVIHPQSIIHSLVEFVDGSMKAQMGKPDMRIPIQYALTFPDRCPSMSERLDLASLGTMTFFPPDVSRFRCLGLAYEALRAGGTVPAVLNAANEMAVHLFLKGCIAFTEIPSLIAEALSTHTSLQNPSLEDLIAIDGVTRKSVQQRVAPAA